MQLWGDTSPYPGGSILIVDDSGEWRTRVREILQTQPDLRIVAEACDGIQAVHSAVELHPDLVLLDIRMPELSGFDAAHQIRRFSPGTKIVFLTHEIDADIQSAALAAGADGYVLKIDAARKLLPTIAAALGNGHQDG